MCCHVLSSYEKNLHFHHDQIGQNTKLLKLCKAFPLALPLLLPVPNIHVGAFPGKIMSATALLEVAWISEVCFIAISL
jgi:hypothetical protein